MMLTPEGWRELLRRTEATLAGPLETSALNFLTEGKVQQSEVGRLIRDALDEVNAAGNRQRVQFRLDVRRALAIAFGAYKLELVGRLARHTEALSRSVVGSMTGVARYEAFLDLDRKHRELEGQVNKENSELRWLSYATKVLFKMSYPEWALD